MMFLNDVYKKEEIKNLALQDLRNLGIKFRLKKPRQHVQKAKSRKVFKVPLQLLPMQTVTMVSGQQLVVPKLIHDMCSYILTKVDTEGLFRKGGSKSRQNEIKLSLDAGCYLGDEHHEIDVASVLKTFFRELPEPLFPVTYHDLFLHCIILPSDNLRAILLACLLLPCEHLNSLAYLMQFLHQVTQCADHNKMDAYNLAVVMGPALLPVEEKLAPSTAYRVNKFCEVFKLLVENASAIGFVPNDIIERIGLSCSSTSLTDEDAAPTKKKKKRRSGSLTRMLNGLKKIVTSKTVEDTSQDAPTPDLLSTPCMTRSAKKRKFDGAGFSIRKKKEIVTKLPQASTLSTPYNPKTKDKDKKWLAKSKSKNNSKANEETVSISSSTSTGTKTMLERRWSQLSHVADFRKNKKRNSCGGTFSSDKKMCDIPTNAVATIHLEENSELKATPEPEYMKISRTEYEEIKSRVTEIERRISIELENTDSTIPKADTLKSVQTVYEHTLEQLEPLSPTTDHLARRLSKELKIRRSAEQKVIRSPSARKIGSLRRRSRELEKQKLIRTQTWHVSSMRRSPQTSLRNSKQSIEIEIPISPHNNDIATPTKTEVIISTSNSINKYPTRSSSFHGSSSISKPRKRLSDTWKTSKEFFETSDASSGFENGERCRASLVRLRNQNAGMVLAKARLFDDLIDSDPNPMKCTPNLVPRVHTNKLGAARNAERQSYRIRALKAEERRMKKSMSPRRRAAKSPNISRQKPQRMRSTQISLLLEEGNVSNKENHVKDPYVLGNCVKTKGSPLRDSNFKDVSVFAIKGSPCTPRGIPHIKKPFNVKSPKRLNRAPLGLEKTTPLKVIATIRQEY